MPDEKRSIWCVVANVSREPMPEGPGGEMRLGTRLLDPGAKLYLYPSMWGDGGEKLLAISRQRSGSRMVEAVVATKRQVDFRAQHVFHPHIVHALEGWWDDSGDSRARATEMAGVLRSRKPDAS